MCVFEHGTPAERIAMIAAAVSFESAPAGICGRYE